ncbi:Galactose-specific lectin nattectin [Dissostichus eleginoides]|uniref:Galactose-specific lectin nattectin n=1 Tax=Dissostichus eleginoides TaxID=100907 RepID=A0AAD9BBR4_DISEL|nr:Galactose-specific lectin nattectin [Dissostichus eleginoides]
MLLFLFLLGSVWVLCLLQMTQGKLQRGSCPMFWYSFNNRCYKYIAADMDWSDAEFHCVSEGANLVSLHSQGEENFVKSLIKNFDPAEGYTWIGLSDIPKEEDGCGLMGQQSTLSFGIQDSQTMQEMKTVATPTLFRNGMISHVLKLFPQFVHLA